MKELPKLKYLSLSGTITIHGYLWVSFLVSLWFAYLPNLFRDHVIDWWQDGQGWVMMLLPVWNLLAAWYLFRIPLRDSVVPSFSATATPALWFLLLVTAEAGDLPTLERNFVAMTLVGLSLSVLCVVSLLIKAKNKLALLATLALVSLCAWRILPYTPPPYFSGTVSFVDAEYLRPYDLRTKETHLLDEDNQVLSDCKVTVDSADWSIGQQIDGTEEGPKDLSTTSSVKNVVETFRNPRF